VRRRLPVAAGIALAAASIALALLAVQAWRHPGDTAREDARLRAGPPADTWADEGGAAAALLGAKDDATFRRAVALFLRGRPDEPGGNKSTDQIVSGLEAAIMLAEIVRGEGPTARRSQAANVQAIILGEDAIFEPDSTPRIARAVELLRRAIEIDPDNDDAKANLELLFQYTGRAGVAAESSAGFGGFGKDAGSGVPGGGY
jgi:tetratricopeptide (TPR) repeat protein